MTKRLISFLLAFSLILCLGACTKAPAKLKATGSGTEADPWAIGATATDDVTAYLVDGNRLMVSGSGAMMDFNSAESTPWASIIADLTEVNVFDGVTKIGNNAFKGAGANSETLDFYIPTGGLDEIGNSAFENANLNSNGKGPFCCISIMSDVKHVGSRAFANVGLTEIQAYCLADNIEKDAFADNSGKFYATALTGYNWDDAIIKEKEVRIVSRVSETEKKKIESLADKCGLSISEYVRKRALGYEPKTVLPDVFFNFYEKLCELINGYNDAQFKTKALSLFDEIHNEFFTEKKQPASRIREEVQNGNHRLLARKEQS